MRLSPQAVSDPEEIPMTTDTACSLPPPQHKHKFVRFDVEMLGKDKEPSTISEILILLRILRFNLYFGTRSHIFPARLLPSINKPRTLLLVGSRKLSAIFTVAMATQIKI